MKAVDLFSGWGGFSLGASSAGVEVIWASDHWSLAIEANQINHPNAAYVCQDLRHADWSALPEYDLLLASPSCQGHSTASRPQRTRVHDDLRETAWSVIDCARETNPAAILVENVLSFGRWRFYRDWIGEMEELGYFVKEHRLKATDFGVPQRRSRLFITATREPFELRVDRMKEPAFGPYIDWDLGDWRPIEDAGIRAQERIRLCRGARGPRFFTQHVTGHLGVPIEESIRTVTCQDQWAVVDGDRYRPLTIRENARAMGFPEWYTWPSYAPRRDIIKGLGNAVCPPVAAVVIHQIKEQCR